MSDVRSLDLTPSTAPALSTTSDMPKGGTKLPPPKGAVSDEEIKRGEEAGKAGDEAEAAKRAAKTKPDDENPEVKKPEVKADDKTVEDVDPDKKPDDIPAWQKREITKARNRQREAEARATHLEERLDKALTALEKAATRTGTEVKTQEADPRPKRTDFDDPEKYEQALVEWSAKSAAKLTQAEIERAQKERDAAAAKDTTEKQFQSEHKERVDAWTKSKEKAIDKYPDYEEVAESDEVPITPVMASSILEENLESGKGFEIAYYLGKHINEAKRIAALPQSAQVIAIGKLAERLAAIPEKTFSKTPTPPKPLGNRSAAGDAGKEPEMEEYATKRNAQLRAGRANPH